MGKPPAITVTHISKSFDTKRIRSLKDRLIRKNNGENLVKAIDDISFVVPERSIIGLYGPNGSGKSTLLRLLAGIMTPDTGTIATRGSTAAVLDLGAGLYEEATGRDNVFFVGSLMGMTSKKIHKAFPDITTFADIGSFIDSPVKMYSTGMRARLAFAIAIHASRADILLLDEILAVGDADFQLKCLSAMRARAKTKTVILASHNLAILQRLCSRVLLLSGGRLLNESQQKVIDLLKSLPAGESFTAEALSNSMLPIIRKGDALAVHRSPWEKVSVGDIIAFAFPNLPQIIVHRVTDVIIKNKEKICSTQGDSVLFEDSWLVKKSDYLGTVRRSPR
ncbi:MAG: signal peptidase I [Candidatus Gottesmanbacteria bacterium]|nr:signal peptidase I [Candidatus Gottesmanbacteria bacterium]